MSIALPTGKLESLIAILVSASEFPALSALEDSRELNAAFQTAHARMRSYFERLGLKPGDRLLDLQDINDPTEVLVRTAEFLKQRTLAVARSERAQDVVFYYVGHGAPIDHAYYLYLGGSRDVAPAQTSLRVAELFRVLQQCAGHTRRYVIIDACYAGWAYEEARKHRVDVPAEREFRRGVALLTSSSADEQSRTPLVESEDAGGRGEEREVLPMFTDALLRVLEGTDETLRSHLAKKPGSLSFETLCMQTREVIEREFKHVRPVIPHSFAPDAMDGEITRVGLFPNPSDSGVPQAVRKTRRVYYSGVRQRRRRLALALGCLAGLAVAGGIAAFILRQPPRVVLWNQIDETGAAAAVTVEVRSLDESAPDRWHTYEVGPRQSASLVLADADPYLLRVRRGERLFTSEALALRKMARGALRGGITIRSSPETTDPRGPAIDVRPVEALPEGCPCYWMPQRSADRSTPNTTNYRPSRDVLERSAVVAPEEAIVRFWNQTNEPLELFMENCSTAMRASAVIEDPFSAPPGGAATYCLPAQGIVERDDFLVGSGWYTLLIRGEQTEWHAYQSNDTDAPLGCENLFTHPFVLIVVRPGLDVATFQWQKFGFGKPFKEQFDEANYDCRP